MTSSNRSVGAGILRFALGIFFIVSGVYALQGNGGEIGVAVRSFLSSNVASIVTMSLVICEIVAGVFLLLSFLTFLGAAARIVLIIIMIVWIAIIVFIDILGANGIVGGVWKSIPTLLPFLSRFSSHLMVLGALVVVR